MSEVLQAHPTEVTLVARTQELARTIQAKLAQGYRVESQNATQAVLMIKGRKRWFHSSVNSRQTVSVDESGVTRFTKIDAPTS